jgi:hypothetical protein
MSSDAARATKAPDPRTLLCPSARPEDEDAHVFGVAVGTAEKPEVAYLDEPQPLTPDVLALSDGLPPDQVFRITSRCVESKCVNWQGRCTLGDDIVRTVPEVVAQLPPCSIRSACRWFAENHVAACLRCPQIVTRAPDLADTSTGTEHPLKKKLRIVQA